MVKKRNEDNIREVIVFDQLRYDDGSEVKEMERFKIYFLGRVNRLCCWIVYKMVERKD